MINKVSNIFGCIYCSLYISLKKRNIIIEYTSNNLMSFGYF